MTECVQTSKGVFVAEEYKDESPAAEWQIGMPDAKPLETVLGYFANPRPLKSERRIAAKARRLATRARREAEKRRREKDPTLTQLTLAI